MKEVNSSANCEGKQVNVELRNLKMNKITVVQHIFSGFELRRAVKDTHRAETCSYRVRAVPDGPN